MADEMEYSHIHGRMIPKLKPGEYLFKGCTQPQPLTSHHSRHQDWRLKWRSQQQEQPVMEAREWDKGVEELVRLSSAAKQRIFDVIAERDRLRTLNAELLAALEEIAWGPLGHPEATHREVLDACVAMARAAIAKAKGE